jgi:hypothetical protein
MPFNVDMANGTPGRRHDPHPWVETQETPMSNTHSSPRRPALAAEALSLTALDQVVGGNSLTHFIRAIVIAGTADAGGSGAPTDSAVATHTQVWVSSAS